MSRESAPESGRARPRIVFALAIVLAGIFIVPSVLAAAPTLEWAVNYDGTSNDGANLAVDSECLERGNALDSEWDTGTIYFAYEELDDPLDPNDLNTARYRAVRGTDGSNLWSATDSLTEASGIDVAGCGMVSDQRGRVYTVGGPFRSDTDLTYFVAPSVYRYDTGDNIGDIDVNDIDPELTLPSSEKQLLPPAIDYNFNTSTNRPAMAWGVAGSSGTNGGVAIGDPTTTHGFVDDCYLTYSEFSGSSTRFEEALYRLDGNTTDHQFYFSIRANGKITAIDPETCALGNAFTLPVSDHVMTFSNESLVVAYAGSGAETARWQRRAPDLGSVVDSGSVPFIQRSGSDLDGEVINIFPLSDGDFIICGRDSSPAFGWVLQVDDLMTTLRWNLTFDNTDPGLLWACTVTADGKLVVAFHDNVASPTEVILRQYGDLSGGLEYAEFNLPKIDEIVDEAEDATGGSETEGDAATGLRNWFVDVGFESTGSLFLAGLFLVTVVFALAAAVVRSVTDSGNAAMMAGTVASMGMMVFNGLTTIWPAWSSVVLIVLSSAVVARVVTNRLAGSGVAA